MKYHLIGKEYVNYISKKTGKPVVGVKLHTMEKPVADNVVGAVTDSFYIGENADCYEGVVNLPVDTDIDIIYNRYGGIDDVLLVKGK